MNQFWVFLIVLLSICCSIVRGKTLPESVTFEVVGQVEFPVLTQMGEIQQELSVCRLVSEFGPDFSLYIVFSPAKEFPTYIDKILKSAHAPEIELKNDHVNVLYTSGANTTCVLSYSLESGYPEIVFDEAIAWNDSGYWRKSASFERYEQLYIKRSRRLNKPVH